MGVDAYRLDAVRVWADSNHGIWRPRRCCPVDGAKKSVVVKGWFVLVALDGASHESVGSTNSIVAPTTILEGAIFEMVVSNLPCSGRKELSLTPSHGRWKTGPNAADGARSLEGRKSPQFPHSPFPPPPPRHAIQLHNGSYDNSPR